MINSSTKKSATVFLLFLALEVGFWSGWAEMHSCSPTTGSSDCSALGLFWLVAGAGVLGMIISLVSLFIDVLDNP